VVGEVWWVQGEQSAWWPNGARCNGARWVVPRSRQCSLDHAPHPGVSVWYTLSSNHCRGGAAYRSALWREAKQGLWSGLVRSCDGSDRNVQCKQNKLWCDGTEPAFYSFLRAGVCHYPDTRGRFLRWALYTQPAHKHDSQCGVI